jgi:sugar phosphate isomerase/epimerase
VKTRLMERRKFIKTTSGSIVGLSLGSRSAFLGTDIEGTNIEQQIRLGIDGYSIRGFGWNAFEIIDYAASVEADSIQDSFRMAFVGLLEDEDLKRVKAHADRKGVAIIPGLGSICSLSSSFNEAQQGTPVEHLLLGVRMAKNLGASVIKCFLGGSGDRRDSVPIPAKMEATIKALRSVRSQAVDAGVKFAIENHGDLLTRELKFIIEEAGPEFVGFCLDSGNCVNNAEDPLMALEIMGPYTVLSHIRDAVMYEHPRGAAVQHVSLGDGNIDFKSFVALWRQLCPQAYFNLEILTGSPPSVIPYLEQDFWTAYPEMPAKDFARFLSLVRNGHPFTGSMMIAQGQNPPKEYSAAILQQQRFDLERSLEYAKKTLDLGVRWRKR